MVVVSSSAVDEPLDDLVDTEDVNVGGNGVDVVVPMESIRAISEWFAKTVYGFFLGKRVAYPFSSIDGLDAMLENGPWFIRKNPIVLKKWNPDVNLLKEDVGNVQFGLNSLVSLSSYARAMIEVRADVELKDNIVVALPKITGEGYYTCNIRVD
ncbi:hypothetical protein Tco_0401906 [Tanacetum coccineum]